MMRGALLLLLCSAPRHVSGHGVLTKPVPRNCNFLGAYNGFPYCSELDGFKPNQIIGQPDCAPNQPSAACTPTTLTDNIVCNDRPRGAVDTQVTAGTQLVLEVTVPAPHPGDCALYVSYDDDQVADGQKQWAKIWEEKDCLLQ